MKKLSATLSIALVALATVGCSSDNTTTSELPPAPESTQSPTAQDTVLAGSEGAGDYNDTPTDATEPVNELDDIITENTTALETSEQAVTEVDAIVAELDAIDEELAALDDLLNDL